MSVNDLLKTLQERNVLPFYMGGFIRDVLQGKCAHDLDTGFVCGETDLHDLAQWAEGQGWKYSVKGKKQVSFVEAAKANKWRGGGTWSHYLRPSPAPAV